MTTDHRREAERLLADADEWAELAGEPTPAAGELSCLACAAVHALLAIHDALTEKPEPEWNFNEVQSRREVMPWEGALTDLTAMFDPLTFAPEAAQEAAGGDLSASEGESGAEEQGEAEEAVEPLWCPKCWHPINWHHFDDSDEVAECAAPRCPCDLAPSVIAQVLIRRAVKQAGGRHV